jgi:hypothetical protein
MFRGRLAAREIWLVKLLDESRNLLNRGGSTGAKFFAARRS